MAGIYLHIPFCEKKCIYCGFYSVAAKTYRQKFIPALRKEILERRNFFSALYPSEQVIRTLYVGGGSPSVLEAGLLKEAVSDMAEHFIFPDTAFETEDPDVFEFTVEVNPDDITSEYAACLKSMGVNRISMGVQSFKDQHLKWMGRRHSSAQAIEAFHTLRDAGFKNISIDLIFGFPLMTEDDWEGNIAETISLNPEHISAYQLGIDQGTPLEKLAEAGLFQLPPEEVCAKMYSAMQQRFAQAGYCQYEVSNFCKTGNSSRIKDCRSRHNSSYWKRIPYLGLGPGAHSFTGRHREWNFGDIATYCTPGIKEIREGETLSPKDIFNEYLMLGLRTSDGISLNILRDSVPQSHLYISELLPRVHSLSAEGLLKLTEDGVIKIPPGKLFVSDGIIRELFV